MQQIATFSAAREKASISLLRHNSLSQTNMMKTGSFVSHSFLYSLFAISFGIIITTDQHY